MTRITTRCALTIALACTGIAHSAWAQSPAPRLAPVPPRPPAAPRPPDPPQPPSPPSDFDFNFDWNVDIDVDGIAAQARQSAEVAREMAANLRAQLHDFTFQARDFKPRSEGRGDA